VQGRHDLLICPLCVADQDQPCCVITVVRVTCCLSNVYVVELLTLGVDTASINIDQ
jgi:hypothetical protein